MAEESYFWDGTVTGDAALAPYDDSEFSNLFFRALLNGTGNQGALRGWLNELEVTDGGGLNASVDTGGAIVYGFWYESDAVEAIAIGNNTTEWVVVRASWAAQTARLAAIAPGAFTQNPGVTYDIPLAAVTTVAGAITLITDLRDYCEFSTAMLEGAVTEDSIQADAVTVAKIADPTRWVTRAYNQFEADATNPATLAYYGNYGTNDYNWTPNRAYWSFSDAVSDTVWCTLQVPASISSATMELFLWSERAGGMSTATAMRWAWSSWDAGAGAVLVNQTGAVTVAYPDRRYPYYNQWGFVETYYSQAWRYAQRDSLGTITVNAGDIIHLELYRDGAHAGDAWTSEAAMFMLEFEYMADS